MNTLHERPPCCLLTCKIEKKIALETVFRERKGVEDRQRAQHNLEREGEE